MSLLSLSPLDGRYRNQVEHLSTYFSEWALIRCRMQIEIAWLIRLSECPDIPHARPLTTAEYELLQRWSEKFDTQDAQRVKGRYQIKLSHPT